jgi:hypothetical protein
MTKKLARVQAFVWSGLGNCTVCIRKAWLAAVIALTLAVIAFLLDWRQLALPSAFIALGLVGLWGAHLFAFASKLRIKPEKLAASDRDTNTVSRRAVMPLLMRTLFLGVVISVMPRSALAQSIALGSCGRDCISACTRPMYQGGRFLGCFGCHSCGNDCRDGIGTAFPNGC